jgi:flagellar basal-body rod protein FlgB
MTRGGTPAAGPVLAARRHGSAAAGVNGDATLAALRLALHRASRRAALVASNLANLDTPGYRAVDLAPEPQATFGPPPRLARTDAGHLPGSGDAGRPETVAELPAARVRNDGNTVDVDREMTLLASLQGRYQTSAELVRKRFALLIYAATDGRNGT